MVEPRHHRPRKAATGHVPNTLSPVGPDRIKSSMSLSISNAQLEQIREFCRRWSVVEFSLFGSALRHDFNNASDIDILVDFAPGAFWGIDEWISMRDELEAVFSRKVDLVSRNSLRNPFRRSEILRTRKVLHAA